MMNELVKRLEEIEDLKANSILKRERLEKSLKNISEKIRLYNIDINATKEEILKVSLIAMNESEKIHEKFPKGKTFIYKDVKVVVLLTQEHFRANTTSYPSKVVVSYASLEGTKNIHLNYEEAIAFLEPIKDSPKGTKNV